VKKWVIILLVALSVGAIVLYTQVTLFIVPPIGAVPEGRTMVIARLNNMQFVDSADAVCERIQGGVNLLCRATVLAQVGSNAKIIMRLPYSSWLYGISTGGKTYSK
jgi:hypothetical protein